MGDFLENTSKHATQSHMIEIDLCDEITVEITETKKIKIELSGPHAKGIPNNQRNKVYTAVEEFFRIQKIPKSFGVHIQIVKNIPHKAGLGGGSSNAATVLKILHFHCKKEIQPEQWENFGNDIRFFLGENLNDEEAQQTISPYNYGVLLLFPKIPISTTWAFGQLHFDRKNKRADKYEGYEKHTEHIKNIIQNDFQPLIFSHFYDIQHTLSKILETNPMIAGMSGGGSSLFAFFQSDSQRADCISKLSASETTISIPISQSSATKISSEI